MPKLKFYDLLADLLDLGKIDQYTLVHLQNVFERHEGIEHVQIHADFKKRMVCPVIIFSYFSEDLLHVKYQERIVWENLQVLEYLKAFNLLVELVLYPIIDLQRKVLVRGKRFEDVF